MSSPHQPLPNPSNLGRAFWLPPGGTDNGIDATAWAELVDLEAREVVPVLGLLASAGIAAYVAIPAGHFAHPRKPICHRLWVDSLQYHHAEDLLMELLRENRHPPDDSAS